MEIIVPIAFAAFGIVLIAFIFIKSHIDSKNEKALMTEIFQKYGVKANAKILSVKENAAYGRHGIQGKYNYRIEFQYNSIKNGVINCTYNLPTNNPRSKRYIDSIPIIYIPAYLDYYNELMSLESFFDAIGCRLNLGYDCWLVIFSEDIDLFTNLHEL